MTATSRAFTSSVVKVTSRHSFILFRPSFYFKGLVWGENLVPFVTKCDYNMPLGAIFDAKKKNLLASYRPNSFNGEIIWFWWARCESDLWGNGDAEHSSALRIFRVLSQNWPGELFPIVGKVLLQESNGRPVWKFEDKCLWRSHLSHWWTGPCE